MPFLFSKAIAVFSTEGEAELAIQAVGSRIDGVWHYGHPARPDDVVHVVSDIQADLRTAGFNFDLPKGNESGPFGNRIQATEDVARVTRDMASVQRKRFGKSDGKRPNRPKFMD